MRKNSFLYFRNIFFILTWIFCTFRSGIMGHLRAESGKKSILIVYHVGEPPWKSSAALDKKNVQALSQATTANMNTEIISRKIKKIFIDLGYRVFLKKTTDIQDPNEYFRYDGLVFGSPNWFSNMAYPLKKLFDEHFIRIWDHRQGKLKNKVLAGFVAAMSDSSGRHCLQTINWVLEQMSDRLVRGIVINVRWSLDRINSRLAQFCRRFANNIKGVNIK